MFTFKIYIGLVNSVVWKLSRHYDYVQSSAQGSSEPGRHSVWTQVYIGFPGLEASALYFFCAARKNKKNKGMVADHEPDW